jgi:predicted dehydrogenase/nucleoside-diphosphate-sugar epimerase
MLATMPFRLALIGAGRAGETLHLPAALASELVQVAAIVDPDAKRAAALARTFGFQCEVAKEIVDVQGPIDGAIIAVPNNVHRAIAVACAERGIHCLIEKPLASSIEDAEAICRLATRLKVTIAVGYSTRFHNEVVLLKQLLDADYFGRIHRFHFQHGNTGGWSPVSGYNLDRAAAGGGVLVVDGTHVVDRMLYWFGYPDDCEMLDDATGGPEAHCLVTLRYRRPDQSFEGTIRLSKIFNLSPGLVIDTEKGQVSLGLGSTPLLFYPHENPELELVLRQHGRSFFPPGVNNFQLQLEDFVAACREERAPLVDAPQGLLSVRLLSELYSRRKPFNEPWCRRPEPRQDQDSVSVGPRTEAIRVAIFGASGFVGATVVERLLQQQIPFTAAVHSTGSAWRLARHGIPLSFVDVSSRAAIGEAMRGCSHIVNCTRGSDEAMIGGLENLLAEAKLHGIQRFVHISSVAVYGDPPPAEARLEQCEPRPAPDSYGALKLRQDELVARAHDNGLSCAVLCPPNITGVFSGFACEVLDDIRQGSLALVEDGRMPINVVDVENLAYAIELALVADRVDGRRMFVTDGDDITWGDFTRELMPLTELETPLPSLPKSTVKVLQGARPRSSLMRTIKHFASSEVRSALRTDPLLGRMEKGVRDLATRLPDRLQDRLRLSIGGPVSVAKVSTAPRFGSRYNQQQLRGVVHSSERAAREIGYTRVFDFAESMARFREWYSATRGIGTESWPLARHLLSRRD